MKNKKINKLFGKVLVLMFIIYFVYTVIAQQKTLNSYAQEKDKYNDNIETAQEEQDELKEMKDNINSDEYIEQIAREKLECTIQTKEFILISKNKKAVLYKVS